MHKSRESLDAQQAVQQKDQKRDSKEVKQRPILMNTLMVQATLKGQKTETRRILKEQPWYGSRVPGGPHFIYPPGSGQRFNAVEGGKDYRFEGREQQRISSLCPYGKVGDVLWVKETWKLLGNDEDGFVIIKYKTGDMVKFHPSAETKDKWDERIENICISMASRNKLNIDDENGKATWKEEDIPWRPSIHMPMEIARIWLEITGKRVEHLQDIHDIGAVAEGIEVILDEPTKQYSFRRYPITDKDRTYETPIESFESLWRSINGPVSWSANPWVWVVQYKQIERPKIIKLHHPKGHPLWQRNHFNIELPNGDYADKWKYSTYKGKNGEEVEVYNEEAGIYVQYFMCSSGGGKNSSGEKHLLIDKSEYDYVEYVGKPLKMSAELKKDISNQDWRNK